MKYILNVINILVYINSASNNTSSRVHDPLGMEII